jgi:hypothetical protein
MFTLTSIRWMLLLTGKRSLEAVLKKYTVLFAKIAQHAKIGAIHLCEEHEG